MKRVIYSVMVLVWMIVIFSFSAQPADTSSEMSILVGYEVGEYFVPGFDEWTEESQDAFAQSVEFPVRKCAHASEYAILAILVMQMTGSYGIKGKKRFLVSLLCVAVYAATDEFHQVFVPGRSPLVSDVLIDTAGGLTGCLVFILIQGLIGKWKRCYGRVSECRK